MPSEILTWFFKYVIGLQSEERNQPRLYFRNLTNLRMVSRRWEGVIVSSAMLWTLIDITKPNTVSMILRRSSGCPLRLVCCNLFRCASDITESAKLLHSSMERVTEFEAVVDGAQLKAILPLLQSEAPRMEVAHISSLTKATLPIRLFQGTALGVSSILLSGIQIELPTLNFAHLKRITLSGIAAPLEAILEILEVCSTHVEVLALDSIDFRESYGARLPAKEPTTLPNLFSLCFTQIEPFAIEYLLASVCVPACVDFRILGTPFAGRSLQGTLKRFVEKLSLRDSLDAPSSNKGVEFDAAGASFYLDDRRVSFSFHFDCDRSGSPPPAVWEEMVQAFAKPWMERRAF